MHLALTHTKRRYVITFGSAYHGTGLGTKLMCGFNSSLNRYLEAWTGGVIKAPYPFSDRRPAGIELDQYVDYCLWYLDNHVPQSIAPRDSIAAVIVEPGLAEGGNWIPPGRFIRGLRELCDKNDWLLVVDEVLTGLGRTGEMLLGVGIQSPTDKEEDWWYARAVRSRMLENGVWAICDRENAIRMYPALNIEESLLREGLDIMGEAIRHIDKHGQPFGDSPAWPTGDAGF